MARAAEAQSVAVLASGDPGFHGIAALVVRCLGPRAGEHPSPTSARCSMPLPGSSGPGTGPGIISLPTAGSAHRLFSAVAHHDLVAVYTDPANTPNRIASLLLERGQPGWRMMVAEGPRRALRTGRRIRTDRGGARRVQRA